MMHLVIGSFSNRIDIFCNNFTCPPLTLLCQIPAHSTYMKTFTASQFPSYRAKEYKSINKITKPLNHPLAFFSVRRTTTIMMPIQVPPSSELSIISAIEYMQIRQHARSSLYTKIDLDPISNIFATEVGHI